ncbi:MAG TPA: hypothetical protein VFT57_12740, partial [Gemmatimonadaceae bacterium]|nr:hypothetical protein [Gemmatimonadaceae bacterium]
MITAISTRRRMRLAAAVTALTALTALSLSACSVEKILDVSDPDIINPSDISTKQGVEALRLGTIARLNQATTGEESFLLLGGLLADEWRSGDSYLDRDETDQRNVSARNGFLEDATRNVYRARLSAKQTIDLLKQYNPDAPGWQAAEMYFVEAYMENTIAENFCSGMPFSTVDGPDPVFGGPMTTDETLDMALAHVDSGLALITGSSGDDARVKNALLVTRGRILLNLDRADEAAAAVAEVPTSFEYVMEQSQTTMANTIWDFNLNVRRYTVSAGEGGVGIDFATAEDPRVPVCEGGSAECEAIGYEQTTVFENGSAMPLYIQLLWPTADAPVTIVSGVEARLIEAEGALDADQPGAALGILNDVRTTVPGLDPLSDAGSSDARVDQLFHERAFWLFSTGHRLGDLRRLVRQYDRAPDTVFPNGAFLEGGSYG